MENQKQKKSVGTIALVVLLLIVTIASLVLATYAWAKYTSKESGNATAPVAKWNVEFTEADSTFVGHYSHVVDGKIAPGTTGTFDITVVPNNTEVCFDYTIKIDSIEFYNGETLMTDNDELADGVTLGQFKSHIILTDEHGVDITNGSNTIKGTFDLTNHTTAGSVNTPGTLTDGVNTVRWTWAYELTTTGATEEQKAAYDAIDTAAGKFAAGTHTKTVDNEETQVPNDFKIKVNYTATAVQVNPTGSHQTTNNGN